jgi:hypothetical protein
MYYQCHNRYRFKPVVNAALSQYEITVSSDFVVGEPYLIEYKIQDTYTNEMIYGRTKGVFVKIFQGSNITHIICRDTRGRSFPSPVEESRFYKSPNHIIHNRLRQQCVVYAINNLTTSVINHRYMQNSIGYELGKGWIWNDSFIEKWYKDEEKNNKNEELQMITNSSIV